MAARGDPSLSVVRIALVNQSRNDFMHIICILFHLSKTSTNDCMSIDDVCRRCIRHKRHLMDVLQEAERAFKNLLGITLFVIWMDTCTVQEHHVLNALHMNIQFDFHKYVY